jgi:hypothetical protein
MLKLILAGAAAMPLAAGATVAATGIAWVDVREGGPRGTHVVVPVPLLAAEVAAAFVPVPTSTTSWARRASTWARPARSWTRCASRRTASWCGSRRRTRRS